MSQSTSADLFHLLQPTGGLFSSVTRVRAQSPEPRLVTQIARLGEISELGEAPVRTGVPKRDGGVVAGSGTAPDEKEALFLALAEGVERYCACVYSKEHFIWATGDELGGEALDLDTIPRCSEAELSRAGCPLSAPSKKEPIRWVRGLSLLNGRPVYLPVVMVYLHAGFVTPAERIWLPLTTGCAGHSSYEKALLNAILEIVERDAISIVWLQKLELPRIEIDDPDAIGCCWDRYERSSQDIEYTFFDATTDLGIPTVYGLQTTRFNRSVTTLVSCATAMSPAVAVGKVIRDAASLRVAFRQERRVPESWEEFTDIFHGATYMARSERMNAFDFLRRSTAMRGLTEMRRPEFDDESCHLSSVLSILRRKGLDVFAVDLTTDEALRSGTRVVRVLIPGLHPLSFHYRARYLGHPRVYEAPRLMGYPVRTEIQLNEWPQPFA